MKKIVYIELFFIILIFLLVIMPITQASEPGATLALLELQSSKTRPDRALLMAVANKFDEKNDNSLLTFISDYEKSIRTSGAQTDVEVFEHGLTFLKTRGLDSDSSSWRPLMPPDFRGIPASLLPRDETALISRYLERENSLWIAQYQSAARFIANTEKNSSKPEWQALWAIVAGAGMEIHGDKFRKRAAEFADYERSISEGLAGSKDPKLLSRTVMATAIGEIKESANQKTKALRSDDNFGRIQMGLTIAGVLAHRSGNKEYADIIGRYTNLASRAASLQKSQETRQTYTRAVSAAATLNYLAFAMEFYSTAQSTGKSDPNQEQAVIEALKQLQDLMVTIGRSLSDQIAQLDESTQRNFQEVFNGLEKIRFTQGINQQMLTEALLRIDRLLDRSPTTDIAGETQYIREKIREAELLGKIKPWSESHRIELLKFVELLAYPYLPGVKGDGDGRPSRILRSLASRPLLASSAEDLVDFLSSLEQVRRLVDQNDVLGHQRLPDLRLWFRGMEVLSQYQTLYPEARDILRGEVFTKTRNPLRAAQRMINELHQVVVAELLTASGDRGAPGKIVMPILQELKRLGPQVSRLAVTKREEYCNLNYNGEDLWAVRNGGSDAGRTYKQMDAIMLRSNDKPKGLDDQQVGGPFPSKLSAPDVGLSLFFTKAEILADSLGVPESKLSLELVHQGWARYYSDARGDFGVWESKFRAFRGVRALREVTLRRDGLSWYAVRHQSGGGSGLNANVQNYDFADPVQKAGEIWSLLQKEFIQICGTKEFRTPISLTSGMLRRSNDSIPEFIRRGIATGDSSELERMSNPITLSEAIPAVDGGMINLQMIVEEFNEDGTRASSGTLLARRTTALDREIRAFADSAIRKFRAEVWLPLTESHPILRNYNLNRIRLLTLSNSLLPVSCVSTGRLQDMLYGSEWLPHAFDVYESSDRIVSDQSSVDFQNELLLRLQFARDRERAVLWRAPEVILVSF